MSQDAEDGAEITLDLVARIQGGDQDVWNDLYRRYHDTLLFAVRCRLGVALRGHLESEDVLQSVVFEAMQGLERFEHRGPGSLRHFLHVLVANKIRDRVDTFNAKKRKGTVALTDSMLQAVPGFVGTTRYHDAERYERLERCMEKLPTDMREVILLRKVEGMSSKEMAEITGKSDAATRKLCSRALARLTLLMSESESS